jgi:hypothetical protein
MELQTEQLIHLFNLIQIKDAWLQWPLFISKLLYISIFFFLQSFEEKFIVGRRCGVSYFFTLIENDNDTGSLSYCGPALTGDRWRSKKGWENIFSNN